MSLAAFVSPWTLKLNKCLYSTSQAMLVKNHPISCLSPVCFKNPPHIIPAFVLTQILQSKLAQIKPHPFSNYLTEVYMCEWF